MGLQQSVTPVMDNIVWFHDFLLYLITAITLFVLVLLLIVIVRFNARANPVPTKTTHNTLLEVAWTLIPVIILTAIAVPSFKLLFLQHDHSAGRPHGEGDRQAVVLDLRLSGQQVRVRLAAGLRQGAHQVRAAAAARRRQRHGGAGQQGGARPGDRRAT